MQIQINTANNLQSSETLVAQLDAELRAGLARFGNRITRLEAHLSEDTAHKDGKENKSCMMEARLEGLQPLTVTNHAATVQKAFTGAEHKLIRLLESTLGRLHDEDRHRASDTPPNNGSLASS